MNLKNKNILVIGLAVTGVPLVKTLLELGAKVIVNDLKPKESLKNSLKELDGKEFEAILGKHPENLDFLKNLDLAVVSPGVPLDIPFIENLRKNKIEVIGEIELAYRLNNAPIIAITGTNGKTTTTALVGEIFQRAEKNTFVVGNIGVAAISKVLETKTDDIMVMEISSFQLESIVEFKPKVAALLNITPDHLNRHKTMENYQAAKFNIFKNQTTSDFAVINYDDAVCSKNSETLNGKKIFFSLKEQLKEGVFVEEDYITILMNREKKKVIHIDAIKIPGKHNLENALAATAMAYIMGVNVEIIKEALLYFKGVEHRIEYVAEVDGIHFINDSKATNTDAAIKAIEAIKPPIILLAGGMDKNSEFKDFIESFQHKVKKLVVYGETAEKLSDTAQQLGFFDVMITEGLEKAVEGAYNIAKEGDTILLSPACASWDMYENFEERGNHFKKLVANLRGS